jgi:hypothetical protein
MDRRRFLLTSLAGAFFPPLDAGAVIALRANRLPAPQYAPSDRTHPHKVI